MKIIWTEGKNLAFPDILSRNIKIKDFDKYQLKHKKIPKDIVFTTSMVTRKNTSFCVITKRDQQMIFFNIKTKRNRYRQIYFQKQQNGKAKVRQPSKQTLFNK